MTNLKVKELIDALRQNEIRSFRLYLRSPFYNSSGQICELFEIILSEKVISKNELFKKLFGEIKYDDKKLRYLFSALTSHLEKFIALVHLEKDEEELDLYRQRSLASRNASKAYSFANKKSPVGKKELRAVSYLNRFRSEEVAHKFNSRQLSRLSELNYAVLLNSLDLFYIVRKLQLQCELINLKNILNKNYEVILIDPICDYILSNSFLGSPLVELYFHVLTTLQNKEPEAGEAFNKILILTEKHQHSLSVEDLNNIYQYAKNYCIRQINIGNDAFRKILFDLYKTILANKRLMDHDYFSTWEFKNIVTLGLRLKEGIWVKAFISKYINFLPPHERKNALTYNTAMHYYYNKNYKFVLKYLQEVEFNDLYYQLDAKSILLKVYFETDEQEALLHHIAAFRVFLLRNKNISAYQMAIYKNFIRYSLKIFRAGTNQKKLLALKDEISSTSNISDRNWLLERVGDLL